MTRLRFLLAALSLALLSGIPSSVLGQDLTMVWEFKVKPGSAAAFEAALKAHMEYRESIGDPWEWLFFQQVIGKNVGMYMARSPSHTWADFDEYMGSEVAQLAGTHFDATVQPLVEEVWNLIDQDNGELSRLPEDIEPYTLFDVTVFNLKPDQMTAFSEAVGKMKQVVVDHDFPFYWGAQVQLRGTEGPSMALVGWAESWADMAEDPAMEAAVVETFGEDGAQELFEQFYGSFYSFTSFIGMKRPDLSTGGGM